MVEESLVSMDVSRNLQLENVGALNACPCIVSAALCIPYALRAGHWWL